MSEQVSKRHILIWGTAARFPNYAKAVVTAGGRPDFSGDLYPELQEICLSKYDALLLPGGGDIEPWRYHQENAASHALEPERDEEELFLLERFINTGKPVLGICRGMQVLNVFFGGTLFQDISGHSVENGVDRLHPVHTAPSLLADCLGSDCVINSAHHQAVDQLGSDLLVLQWAPDGIIEAIQHRELPVLGVQWHPERIDDPGTRFFQFFLQTDF